MTMVNLTPGELEPELPEHSQALGYFLRLELQSVEVELLAREQRKQSQALIQKVAAQAQRPEKQVQTVAQSVPLPPELERGVEQQFQASLRPVFQA